jgi:hypothetical protein
MSLEFSEGDIEEIIARHPEIIEKSLKLKGRQATFRGKRVDLIFADKFGDTLIVELKRGFVKREHVGQLAEYLGYVEEQEEGRIRIMLIGSGIPPYLRRGMKRLGIEFREITNRDYIEFLKEKDPTLLKELQKKQLQQVSPLERPKERALIKPIRQKLGILWSHNEQTYPTWLTAVTETIKLQGYIWWDVGWKIRVEQFTFPVKGYICCKGKITHEASIDSIIHQPDKELIKEVAENFEKLYRLGIYRPPYSKEDEPYYQYLKGEREVLTLLKLTELKELSPPRKLTDLKLWKTGKAISRCPQGYHRIILPGLEQK